MKATGKWKATLVTTVAAASTVAMATAASASGGSSGIWNNASSDVDQHSGVKTFQVSVANSGFNHAKSWVDGANVNGQSANGSADGGNVTSGSDVSNVGNLGAAAENNNTGANDGKSDAKADSGDASADNKADTKVDQNNNVDVTGKTDANNSNFNSWGGGINNNASSNVNQKSWVGTTQIAVANSGFNSAKSGVSGLNLSDQSADGSAHEGNVSGNSGTVDTVGNTAGPATNTNSGDNKGESSASATSGNASASNSSNTQVSQSNGGSVTGIVSADNSNFNGGGQD